MRMEREPNTDATKRLRRRKTGPVEEGISGKMRVRTKLLLILRHGEKDDKGKPLPPATEEEMNAWLAYFIQDLVVLKKRRSSASILQEERDFLKEQMPKYGKKPILAVYYAELKELEIWKDV